MKHTTKKAKIEAGCLALTRAGNDLANVGKLVRVQRRQPAGHFELDGCKHDNEAHNDAWIIASLGTPFTDPTGRFPPARRHCYRSNALIPLGKEADLPEEDAALPAEKPQKRGVKTAATQSTLEVIKGMSLGDRQEMRSRIAANFAGMRLPILDHIDQMDAYDIEARMPVNPGHETLVALRQWTASPKR